MHYMTQKCAFKTDCICGIFIGVYVRIQGDGYGSIGSDTSDEEYFDRRLYVYGNGNDIKLPGSTEIMATSF